jgi:hypothetical protein
MSYGIIKALINRRPPVPTSNVAVKKYIALITQASTAAPSHGPVENTVGDIVWTRVQKGVYRGTSANAFTEYKTFLNINKTNANMDVIFVRENVNSVIIMTNILFISVSGGTEDNEPADGLLNSASVEIIVYP